VQKNQKLNRRSSHRGDRVLAGTSEQAAASG